MPVAMQAIKVHTHYDPTGVELLVHHPGDRYELADSNGMTADQLANVFTQLGVACRLADTIAKTKADQLAQIFTPDVVPVAKKKARA